MIKIRYAQIRKMDISNGCGIGVSIFVQGCPFHCNGCFNSETWDFNGGKEWTEETKKQFINLMNKPHITRMSILGGEPLAEENLSDVLDLVNEFRLLYDDTKTIWLYSGFDFEVAMQDELRNEIIRQCDVMVDGRYIDSLRDITLKWRGSSNQRVIDIKKTLEEGHIVLWTN